MRDEELLALMRTARDASDKALRLRRVSAEAQSRAHEAFLAYEAACAELKQAQAALVAKVCPAA